MLEILITISIVGLIAGIVFSVPVAGPISIFVASHGLKGNLRYCAMAAVGAAIVDFAYCFIAVFCFTQLYALYQHIIHVIFLLGSIFLFVIGYKIMRTKLELPGLGDAAAVPQQTKEKGGFRIGFMLNLLNPSLFIGWLVSSLLIMSIVSSLGFNTGGLDSILDRNMKAIHSAGHAQFAPAPPQPVEVRIAKPSFMEASAAGGGGNAQSFFSYSLLVSLCYAFFVAVGTIIWFYFFSFLLVTYRKRLKTATIERLIRSLGFALVCFGLFLSYQAILALVA